jgi:hypothetical protein
LAHESNELSLSWKFNSLNKWAKFDSFGLWTGSLYIKNLWLNHIFYEYLLKLSSELYLNLNNANELNQARVENYFYFDFWFTWFKLTSLTKLLQAWVEFDLIKKCPCQVSNWTDSYRVELNQVWLDSFSALLMS